MVVWNNVFLFISGAWGYGSKFRALEKALLAEFPSKLEISGEATPTATGLFEVLINENKLVWSKKQTNKFPTSERDMDGIFDQIEEVLEQKKD